MSYYYDERQRRQAWDDDDWQPESERDRWQEAQRRRQQLTPGQTSYGGPARQGSGYSGEYGAGRYPERPTQGEYGSSRGDYRGSYGSEYRGQLQQRARRGGQDYQSQQGYQGSQEYQGYEGRRYERDENEDRYRRRAGSSLRYGLNGGYGWERAGEWRDPQAWKRDDEYAERQWRESADRARDPYESARDRNRDRYFRDLRSDTRYWTEDRDEREDERRFGQRYSREAARQRGWETDDREGYRDDDREDHGVLYNLGRRIGEAVGDLFGTDQREHERKAGPRGYQRSDDRIRDQICERLSYARGVDVSDVSVDVKEGVVSLTGSVRERGQKYYIEDLADGTYGVKEVNNDIRVRREGHGTSAGSTATSEATGSTWRA
ncbi:BON domain-containing protein [Cupriavidus consociatus]|uniref:BON domain-containing protein n=1 Tax=Cupriavidus consociatus TaxID=2821357 RepID=UPI001AE424ED|nr:MULTISPECIES: BON domain-containing protein [unclassified Cupriavidus]MBP0619828.1 BON domain-containing protein [Cupriavidus sp. LEh25]MDK2656480.1 BON domain-containing protein [Cupriavidus sp. LEh21]